MEKLFSRSNSSMGQVGGTEFTLFAKSSVKRGVIVDARGFSRCWPRKGAQTRLEGRIRGTPNVYKLVVTRFSRLTTDSGNSICAHLAGIDSGIFQTVTPCTAELAIFWAQI